MQRRFYKRMVEAIEKREMLRRVVVILCRVAPWFVVFAYVVTLLILLGTWNLKWIFFLIVPAVSVGLVTVLRIVLDKPRPFERFVYEPLIPHGSGKSFPSRHTASAVVIGMACFYVNHLYGILMLVLAGCIGVTRIMAGVHHIWDLIAGAGISVGLGLLGFWLIAPLFGL